MNGKQKMLKEFKTYINESTNLAPSQLYKYDWRLELFIKKFKEGLPIQLVSGSSVILTYDAAIEDELRNKINPARIKFHANDNQKYTLGKFAKTKEFGGGGGGSGAGASLTKTTESAQALYCQARWMGKNDYSEDELTTAYTAADVDESLNVILNQLPDSWIESSKLGAEKLHKMFGNKQYTFHRGSKWVETLEKTFKKLNSKEKQFSNLNKWSPADIYMVSPVGKSIRFENANSIAELNGILTDALKSKDIIGVSLKKLIGSTKASYYNFDGKKPSIKFDKYTTGSRGFFKSKDVYIYFTQGGRIQFRTFPSTFQGEIKGKKASQGKIGYGPIQTIFKNLKLPKLDDSEKIRSLIKKKDEDLLSAFYTNYSRYSTDSSKEDYATFKENIFEKGESWIFSKFIGCQILDIIVKNKKENDFITVVIQYAASASELSAPFLKLE